MKTKNISVVCFIIILALLQSCVATQITNSWQATNAYNLKFNKVMVISLMNFHSYYNEDLLEASVVKKLRRIGINAIPSSTLFGHNHQKIKQNEDSAFRILRKNNIEAVFTITLLSKQRQKDYVPPVYGYGPGWGWGGGWGGWGGYYSGYWNNIYSPGYVEINTNYNFQISLYNVTNDSLLYANETNSFNPNSFEQIAKQEGRILAQDLLSNHVFRRHKRLRPIPDPTIQ